MGYSRIIRVCFFGIGFLILPFLLVAQEQWERDGEIEDVEIEIVRERQIVLPRANRNFEKVPPRPVEPITPAINYTFKKLDFSAPDYNPGIRPLRLKQEEISKIYGNYVSVGFGNYSSPYLNARFNTKRDKSRFLGASVFHRSYGKGPVDGTNSANGNTAIKLFGTSFTNSVTASAYLGFENTTGHFYGYPGPIEASKDTIRQVFNQFSIGGELSNTRPGDFNYTLSGELSYLTDHYQAAESDLGVRFSNSYKINDKTHFNLESSYSLISRKDSLINATPRHLLKAHPAVKFSVMEKLSLTVGVNAVLENDSIRNKSFHLYPAARAEYGLTQKINAYASLLGDMEKVNLHSVYKENFWVNSNIGIFHTNKTVDLVAGIQGKIGSQLAFDVGFSAANLKDLYFYQNAVTDQSKFDLVYDLGDVQRLNLFGEIALNKNEVVRLNIRGDYYGYSTDQQAEAWHRPTYRFTMGTSFNIYQKVMLKAGFIGQGGMKVLDDVTSQVVTLDPALDLNVQATYRLSRQVSAFLKFENLLATDYPLYLNYPVRGFQVLGGVSWSF